MGQPGMISESELEELLERARGNPEADQEFFRRLLDATLHVHTPISDDSTKLRLIQFKHPDGFNAIPCFTSVSKAAAAAGHWARIMTFKGRELLEMTRGATLMINPNDGGAVLYPEEIESLLNTGSIAQLSTESFTGERFWFDTPAWQPAWLIPVLTDTLAQQSSVEVAYLIQKAPEDNPNAASLLIVLGVGASNAERAARACLTSVQTQAQPSLRNTVIDLTTYDPAEGAPDFVSESGVEPFYRRENQ